MSADLIEKKTPNSTAKLKPLTGLDTANYVFVMRRDKFAMYTSI